MISSTGLTVNHGMAAIGRAIKVLVRMDLSSHPDPESPYINRTIGYHAASAAFQGKRWAQFVHIYSHMDHVRHRINSLGLEAPEFMEEVRIMDAVFNRRVRVTTRAW